MGSALQRGSARTFSHEWRARSTMCAAPAIAPSTEPANGPENRHFCRTSAATGPNPAVSTPSSSSSSSSSSARPHRTPKHCTRTAHHWPGDTCRLVLMGHRAFLRA
eukprot:6529017-Prymnesium_polylepis.2